MTRFAGQDNILGKIQELERASEEGSVPYLTPYMSSQNKRSQKSGGGSYFDYIEEKRKELDDIVNTDGGPWKKKIEEKEEEPVIEEKPVKEQDPVDEKSDGLKFTEKLYKKQLDEGMSLEAAMKFNPATTPEDWARAFGKCRTTTSSDKHSSIPSDCYWPEEGGLEGSDFYSVGKGGGTAHAKAGQAASRAKASAARNMSAREGKRKATRSQSKSGR